MNEPEVVYLTRIIRSAFPAQKIDDLTPDTWAPSLTDIALNDALAAVQNLVLRQSFASVADIALEVKAMRKVRLERADSTFVPSAAVQSFEDYQRELLEHRRGIGNGVEPVQPVLERAAPPKAAIANVFPSVPRAERNELPAAAKPEPKRGGPSEENLAAMRAEFARLQTQTPRGAAS